MSMILATSWVRRGVAAQFPTKYEIDEAEMGRISKLAKLQLEDAQEGLEKARKGQLSSDEDEETDESSNGPAKSSKSTAPPNGEMTEYNFDDYDNEDVEEDGDKMTIGNVQSLAYHAPHEEDPYITLPEGEISDEEEREELQILATDNLLLAAKVEDEVAHLEVYVYEDEADNLYVHHDLMLPAIPLAVEWIDLPLGKSAGERTHGSFVAVGTMEPDIEIWDLDVVDGMYPDAILGQGASTASTPSGTGKKKKKKVKTSEEYHVDAVLALAANRQHRNLLASGSADKTVKLWDLNTAKCAKSYSMHNDKVCSLDWHPIEATVLLSGSYDQKVVATDMRAPEAVAPQWAVGSDVESVRWNPHDSNYFYVTTEAGMVLYHDARTATGAKPSTKPVWTLQAHDGAVSSFDINPTVPNFLATGSDDKSVKLWNVQDNRPSMVVSRNLDVGRVFSTRFAPDAEIGFRLAVAGSEGQLQVWDTSTNAGVRRAFANRVPHVSGEVKERFVGVANDNSSESDDDDDDGGVETGEAEHQNGWESMDED